MAPRRKWRRDVAVSSNNSTLMRMVPLPMQWFLIEGLREITEYTDIFLFFPPITQSCSVSDVLFTGGKGVPDFSVLKYY